MTSWIQLCPNPLEPRRAEQQRSLFREAITQHMAAQPSWIIIVEPDAYRASLLSDEWQVHGSVRVVPAAIVEDEQTTTTEMFYVEQPDNSSPLTTNVHALHRRFPTAEIESVIVPSMTIDQLIEQEAPTGVIALISVDAATKDLARLAKSQHMDRIQSIAVSWDEQLRGDADVENAVNSLRAQGFIQAGRPWGEAGEALLLTRPSSTAERLSAMGRQVRAEAGAAVVTARDSWLGPAQRAKALLPLRVAASPTLSQADVLDDKPMASLAELPLRKVEAAVDRAETQEPELWSPPVMPIDDPWALAQECHDRHGVWPISFSYPRPAWPISPEPGTLISPITPGLPYSFDDEDAYRRTYANAYWGITHRKAGWDCFRHVEIMSAGATPWMLDAAEIPRYSMVHYPKAAMTVAGRAMLKAPRMPDLDFRRHIHHHFEQHLTSRAMAHYLLRAAGLQDARSVLFVDERLPLHADYQSMLTLIGLKQLLGGNCHVQYPVDYLYDDTPIDTSTLYGRGFGYTRVLSAEARSTTERGSAPTSKEFDAVIVGSVTRNADLADALLKEFSAERTVWVHGEDLPPTVDEVSAYRRSRVHMFVRAIHTSR